MTPLKTFLQKHAKTYEERGLARTYAAFHTGGERDRIVAYIGLTCGEVVAEDGGELVAEDAIGYNYDSYPAIKIARLAVDRRWSNRGLGRHLVEFALGTAKDSVSPHVGCRFVVVDSKQGSIRFYEKCGFTMLETRGNRAREKPVMFVDLTKIDG